MEQKVAFQTLTGKLASNGILQEASSWVEQGVEREGYKERGGARRTRKGVGPKVMQPPEVELKGGRGGREARPEATAAVCSAGVWGIWAESCCMYGWSFDQICMYCGTSFYSCTAASVCWYDQTSSLVAEKHLPGVSIPDFHPGHSLADKQVAQKWEYKGIVKQASLPPWLSLAS